MHNIHLVTVYNKTSHFKTKTKSSSSLSNNWWPTKQSSLSILIFSIELEMSKLLNYSSLINLHYRAHRHGRVVVEQTNGQIKMKFPCLRKGLRIAPERACSVVVACVVLFNFSKQINDPYLGRQHRLREVEMPEYNGPPNAAAELVRDRFAAIIHAQ